jgi:hypothetical protein
MLNSVSEVSSGLSGRSSRGGRVWVEGWGDVSGEALDVLKSSKGDALGVSSGVQREELLA